MVVPNVISDREYLKRYNSQVIGLAYVLGFPEEEKIVTESEGYESAEFHRFGKPTDPTGSSLVKTQVIRDDAWEELLLKRTKDLTEERKSVLLVFRNAK